MIKNKTISAAGLISFAILTDNSLWVWGLNYNGIFGDESYEYSVTPKQIMQDVLTVDSGLIIKTDKTLTSCWGNGEQFMNNVVGISAGRCHTLAIKSDNSLWVWGKNKYGQLGDGTTIDKSKPIKIMEDVSAVCGGKYNSMAIKTDGTLWAWGHNKFGHLGDGTTEHRLNPVKIMDNAVMVNTGLRHTVALKTDGSLWTWGKNNYCQLGDGTWNETSFVKKNTPIMIMDDVVKISTSGFHTMAIKSDNSLWGWGNNATGQIGDGSIKRKSTPTKVMENVVDVSSGEYNTIALTKDGSLWAWGKNNYGQLGNGTTKNIKIPVKVMSNIKLPS